MIRPRKTPPDDAILTRIADRIAERVRAADRRLDPTRCWSCGVSLLAPGNVHAVGCRRWGV